MLLGCKIHNKKRNSAKTSFSADVVSEICFVLTDVLFHNYQDTIKFMLTYTQV